MPEVVGEIVVLGATMGLALTNTAARAGWMDNSVSELATGAMDREPKTGWIYSLDKQRILNPYNGKYISVLWAGKVNPKTGKVTNEWGIMQLAEDSLAEEYGINLKKKRKESEKK